MTWDFQGRNWQVGRREEEFTAGGPRWEGHTTAGGNWQVGRREEEFTAGDGTSGTSKGDEFTT